MTLVEKINQRYAVAQQDLVELHNQPPQTYRERKDYEKAVKAGRKPTKQTKYTLQLAHEMEVERRYVNQGMYYVIDLIKEFNIREGGVYNDLLERIGEVDEKIIQASYETE